MSNSINDNFVKNKFISLSNVTKNFGPKKRKFTALKDISFSIDKNEFVFITGRSGSGKSTLLNMISGIDKPTTGNIVISGIDISTLSENELTKWRGRNIGVVFQFFQLIPSLTILENILLPMDFCNIIPKKNRLKRANQLLEKVGIPEQAKKLPHTLSGGQQQRAAIARALANDPAIIIADEPTGNLDSESASSIFDLFKELVGSDKTIIVVTHEQDIASIGSSHIIINDGKIV